ncbi:hypothetical protein OG616_21455 [Streptomyces antibioticus]|uniref:hypothetical protein n=1 Tax=Streptomyces antibioticus TaxID=1890 RepID=UPI00224EAD3D|nr:hypothetical protein [Streptomyces antibioticus]MCX5170562.1 hypothetical protein [Streptomyces antibioticus]
MSVDFNGVPVEVSIPGDRAHRFTLPRNRGTLPPKLLKAFEALETAREKQAAVRLTKANDRAALSAAQAAVTEALHGVYDTAAATSRATVEHHREQHAYAVARFERAIGEARTALQAMIDHAQQAAHPAGVGFNSDPRAASSEVRLLRVLAEALRDLPAVPVLG